MDVLNSTPSQWYGKESDFLCQLKEESVWNKLPLLNVNDLHKLRNKQLVRFRGMIQNMYGPEYYMEKFEVINEDNEKITTKIGKYVDVASCQPNETINGDDSSILKGERQTYVAITVPAMNPWVRQIEEEQNTLPAVPLPSTSSCNKTKRPSNEMDIDESLKNLGEAAKKMCIETSDKASSTAPQDCSLHFPLPDTNGKICYLKVYENCDSLKLNSVCEFVGFLSSGPIIIPNQTDEEISDSVLPSSLIPTLHCVSFKHLKHNNPLVVEKMTSERMQIVRKELLILLTQLLCGDELAAEYLIYHLISEVYIRKDLMALGKFSMNISHVPRIKNMDFVRELYKFIELMVTKSHYLGMSLVNMNSQAFIPKQDYASNCLASSVMQLSANTHLVVDETKLSAGKLNETGLGGVHALAKVVKYQKATYDFTYYQIDFDCDIPLLICSEGKSMLPSDIHVILKPDDMHLKTYPEILEAGRHFLKSELLNDIRIYLTSARLVEYTISDGVNDLVQNEFVNMRQNGDVSVDDLHNLLVLARLVCLSEGKSTLNEDTWKKACSLEEARKKRMAVRTSK